MSSTMSSQAASNLPSGMAAMANRPVNNPVKQHRPKNKGRAKAKLAEKRPPGSRIPTKQEVVNGMFLPKTERQAIEASETRRRLLKKRESQIERRRKREELKSVKPPKKGGSKQQAKPAAPGPNLALMPEFFDNKRYTKAEKEEGPVRCVCKQVTDDGQHMIQCENEGCDVWQHTDCMGEFGDAVPEDTEEGHYQCQVCDPWAHREKIQQIRSRDHLEFGKKESKDWKTTQQT